MKNIIFTTGVAIGLALCTYGQEEPTAGNSTNNNNNFWTRATNTQGQGGNLFGTRWNSPVYFYTGGTMDVNRRAKLNGVFNPLTQYEINGYVGGNVNTTGYFLLGENSNAPGGNIYSQLGAFSLLHLNGRDQPGVQEGGFRPWMKTGVTFTDNNDLSYMGIRAVGSGNDITETVIAWSDNQGTSFPGPDDMVFRFTTGGNGNMNISPDLTTANDLDGRHIARFAASGEFGLGNTFGSGSALYVRPQSLLHMSLERSSSVWAQFTNQTSGQTLSDGLRMGLLGGPANISNGNALIYQQENRHLLFSTSANTNLVNPNNTLERMRITAVSAPTNLPGGGYGLYNPGNINGNRTRVAISHNPANPVTRPLSLLHLGYNTGQAFLPGTTDGWRSWMDVGMFVAQGTDNMYFGLKPEGNDRFDAVINWGDNQGAFGPFPIGPDNLRFVFTSTTGSGSGDPISTSQNGLEVGRFEPTQDQNGLANSYGKLGVGDFYTTPAPVTHKLHVRGNGRFEYIPEEGAESIILGKAIDPNNPDDVSFRRLAFTNDPNQVLLGDGTWGTVNVTGADDQNLTNATLNGTILTIEIEDGNPVSVDLANLQDGIGTDDQNLTNAYLTGSILTIEIENGSPVSVDLSGLAVVLADNGLSIDPTNPNRVQFGQDFGALGDPAKLINNREVPMNDHNIVFTNSGSTDGSVNRIGIGTFAPQAKMHVKLDNNLSTTFPFGVKIENEIFSTLTGTEAYGEVISVTGINSKNVGSDVTTTNANFCLGAEYVSTGVKRSQGVNAVARNGELGNTGITGVASTSSGFSTLNNYGVIGRGINGIRNNGGEFMAFNTNSVGETNTAVRADATGADLNYGVKASASGGISYAGWFSGNVNITGGTLTVNGSVVTSDQMFKENVQHLNGAMDLISGLQPRLYTYDTTNFQEFGFESDQQMGLIAQEVEQIIPAVVSEHVRPAQFDSLGNEILPELSYKGIEYEELIPLLIAGMQEQNSTIDSLQNELAQKDSLINDVNDRLTQLENCLSNLLPALCQINNSTIQQNDEQTQEALLHQINIELFDGENIILEQNIPNPFAERTVINYQIPASVGDAKLLFYNNQGRMIREVNITERGAGQINVFGAELSKGTYSYTLICDGEIIATKKMVKQ